MLTVITWLWGDKYGPDYVEKLAAGVRRHLVQRHRFFCLTERERKVKFSAGIERHAIKDPILLAEKGCFARLRMFDPGWQGNRRIDDRMVCIDLDNVIVGPLDHLFNRRDPFTILQGVNTSNPCPFNGSMMMLQAGAHPEVWTDFSLRAAYRLPYHDFPDDQGWLYHKVPKAAAWTPADGVYAFEKTGWPKGEALPANARVVAFPGWRDPSAFSSRLPWVAENWRV